MKKLLAIALAIIILILAVGCSTNSPPTGVPTGNTSAIAGTDSTGTEYSNTDPEEENSTEQTDKNSSPTTSSTTEGTESNPTTSAPPETSTSGNTEDTAETSNPSETENTPETSNPPTQETSKPGTDTPEESKPPETSKPEETIPPETSKPEETSPPETSKPEETNPPETSEPEETQPPKSAYEYPFDIEQIRRDCIAIAESYGMRLDESLNKNNSSWANPDPASPNTQGARLKRLLSETIEYYTDDYREAMGLTLLHISSFNIYCEPTGDGSYLIYFLH